MTQVHELDCARKYHDVLAWAPLPVRRSEISLLLDNAYNDRLSLRRAAAERAWFMDREYVEAFAKRPHAGSCPVARSEALRVMRSKPGVRIGHATPVHEQARGLAHVEMAREAELSVARRGRLDGRSPGIGNRPRSAGTKAAPKPRSCRNGARGRIVDAEPPRRRPRRPLVSTGGGTVSRGLQ
jgi:hypothetical protein